MAYLTKNRIQEDFDYVHKNCTKAPLSLAAPTDFAIFDKHKFGAMGQLPFEEDRSL